jgi:hypothetical protein
MTCGVRERTCRAAILSCGTMLVAVLEIRIMVVMPRARLIAIDAA